MRQLYFINNLADLPAIITHTSQEKLYGFNYSFSGPHSMFSVQFLVLCFPLSSVLG